jgi:hypothetical protein
VQRQRERWIELHKEGDTVPARRRTPIAGDAGSGEERDRSPESQVYQVRIRGHLNGSWSEWFEGASITQEEDGTTVLTGPVADQPALHGLLVRIRDLGLPLLSVNCVQPKEGEAPGSRPEPDVGNQARRRRR